jgi:hypothetical protein
MPYLLQNFLPSYFFLFLFLFLSTINVKHHRARHTTKPDTFP